MSSSNYTRMENTIVSGSSLLSNLMQGYDYMDLQFQASLNRNPIIDLTTSNRLLTTADCVQAVVSTQLVDATAVATDCYLYTGTDSASQAASYINLFDLASGIGSKVLLHFQITGAEAAEAVYLGATGSTNTNCYTLLSGGVEAAPRNIMFSGPGGVANVGTAGAIATVECYALNVTEGSEVVVFNILGLVSK